MRVNFIPDLVSLAPNLVRSRLSQDPQPQHSSTGFELAYIETAAGVGKALEITAPSVARSI
jgi:hypothetical protein